MLSNRSCELQHNQSGKIMSREQSMFDRAGRLFVPNPDETTLNAHQQETAADGAAAREAERVCQIFHRPRQYNSPANETLRSAYKGREVEYLYSRFADLLCWNSMGQAERFYRKHR